MANAKQCDRCGKYYNKNGRYANPHQFDDTLCTAGPVETEYMAGVSINNQLTRRIANFDLCDDCMGDFINFMDNPPTREEETE